MSIEKDNVSTHSLYAVLNEETGTYFAGFNPAEGKAATVDSPLAAKLFANKHEIKLRPTEKLVEIEIDLTPANTRVSDPFRPRRRDPRVITAKSE